jgi:hypothetical protein
MLQDGFDDLPILDGEDARDDIVFGKLLSLPPGDVAVPPVISNHLLPPVWDMRAHRREPFLGVEDLPVFAVLRRIDDVSFIGEIHCIRSWEKDARMMYHARFSIASSSWFWMRFPQKTWNPECRQVESMVIISREIFPLAISMRKTLFYF